MILRKTYQFLRRQELYLAVAVIVYGVLWALRQPERFSVVLVYSLCLGNMMLYPMEVLGPLYVERPRTARWVIFLALIAIITPISVVLTLVIVYRIFPPPHPQGGLLEFIANGWKFPSVVVVTVAIFRELYRSTKRTLERHNRQLQQAMDLEIAQREFQEEELQRAREIQQALLPTVIPQVPGFEVAAAWEPARAVGGDYFDVIRLGPGKLGLCIADVSGKGFAAALLMANVQATVRAFAANAPSAAWLCSRVNSVLCSNIASGKFVTLFYGVLEADTATLQYCNAGHQPPLLVRPGGELAHLDANGAALGVFPHWKYEDATAVLSPGHRLLLLTDGITEAADGSGDEFGERALLETARTALQASAAELTQHLLAEAKRFCDSHLHDDATVLVLAAADREAKQLAASVP